MKEQSKDQEPEFPYFAFQASWGITKHMGGRDATQELIKACRITKDSYVLDVGSGAGITACILAKEYGCDVAGVDLSEDMIQRARERAARKNFSGKIQFTAGDARNLPFKKGTFDAVICESVTAFPKEKQMVVNEYARAAKPGGYVGMNEVTWIEPPPPQLDEYLHRALGRAEFLRPEGWVRLLDKAGLKDVHARIYRTNMLRQWASEIRQMNLRDYLGAWRKFFALFFKSPEAMKWIKHIAVPPKSIINLFQYFGFGIYTGRK